MGTTTGQIEAHIEQTRDALSTNLDELEQKVRTAADWRHHFRTKPKTLLGIALGGGIALAAVLGGRNPQGNKRRFKPSAGAAPSAEPPRQRDVAGQSWDKVKAAIVAAATARLLSYTAQFLGSRSKFEHNEKTDGVFSPPGRLTLSESPSKEHIT